MGQILKHPKAKQIVDRPLFRRLWIVSGGQTGVDQAAMDFALENGLPARGWCPLGRISETGTISPSYPLQESSDEDPALRTELNTYDSDGTLILSFAGVSDGTVLTEECARSLGRPVLKFNIEAAPSKEEIARFQQWISDSRIRILNIAGSRESFRPGEVYSRSKQWIERLFSRS